MPVRMRSKRLARSAFKNVFALSGFHCLPWILDTARVPHHEAVAGFCSPSFEGANKSGSASAALLGLNVQTAFRLPPEA
jgi:hypothetical protein